MSGSSKMELGNGEAAEPSSRHPGKTGLKICFFSHGSHLTGAERSLLQLVRELIADHGAECHVVLPHAGPLKERLESVGATTHTLPYGMWLFQTVPDEASIHAGFARDLTEVLEGVTGFLAELDPDLIYTNTLVIPWGAAAAALLNKPHVWHIREFGRLDYGLQPCGEERQVLDIIEASSHRIVANSLAVRKELFGDRDDETVPVVYNCITVPDPIPDEPARFQTSGGIKLLMLATVLPSKGQIDAVLAVKLLTQAGVPAQLVLAGAGAEVHVRELQDAISREHLGDRVRLVPFLEHPFAILKQADVLLVCSRNEAFGRSTVEGMLMGKVVIGTNSGGTPEIIQDGKTGFLYSPGDHQDLARKIEHVARNPAVADEVGARARAWAASTFTSDRYGGRIHRELTRLVDSPPRDTVTPWSRFLLDHLLLAWELRKRDWRVALAEKEAALRQREDDLREAAERSRQQDQDLRDSTERLRQRDAELADIRATRLWRARQACYRLRDRLLPRRGGGVGRSREG